MDLKGTFLGFKGAFDSFEHEHLPRTKYDTIVDETSNKPGEQAFEVRNPSQLHDGDYLFTKWSVIFQIPHLPLTKKLISGRYLGEILRLVVCELIDEGILFLGQNTYKLEKPYCFDTAFLSLMER
jgi:hexokinase